MSDKTLHILIVDDDAVDRRIARRAFRDTELEARADFAEAETADQALALIRERSWDCVLLDYRLPDADGIEVLGSLASDTGEVEVPVVMLTGAGDTETAVAAMRRGARDYLVKDVDGRYQALIEPVVQRVLAGEEVRRARKLAEAELQASRDRLEEQVAERTAQLRKINGELERFAYTVAHDLKTPLHGMLFSGRILARLVAERLSETEREQFDEMLEAARQMADVIDGLLEYARASQREPFAPVDLHAVFERCLKRLSGDIEAADAVITHDPLPTVPGKRVLLTQALQNLLANALKYRGETAPRVHVEAQRGNEEWILSVRDNGVGIRPERQAQIFEAFTRAHAENAYVGLGLGLALVKGAADRHGGRVWVESTPGEGSVFYLALPDKAGYGSEAEMAALGRGGA